MIHLIIKLSSIAALHLIFLFEAAACPLLSLKRLYPSRTNIWQIGQLKERNHEVISVKVGRVLTVRVMALLLLIIRTRNRKTGK